jgi:hypothetical protein
MTDIDIRHWLWNDQATATKRAAALQVGDSPATGLSAIFATPVDATLFPEHK